MNLTAEQQTVVDIDSGRHLVLAPPGTGKTQMLTERVKRALERGVRPEEMICGTFTNRAAAEMRDRVKAELGKDDDELPLIGTLHHICHRLLFGKHLVPQCRQVVDGNFRDETLNMLKKMHPAPDFFLERHYMRDMDAGEIDYYRYNRDYSDAINLTLALRAGTPTEFLPIRKNPCVGDTFVEDACDAYEKIKKDLFVFDFYDLLIETYKALTGGNLPPDFSKYKWLQIDEVQDLSPLQWAIVDALAAPGAVFAFFGDYEQSIYSFLGASTKLLDRKAEDCEIHFFETNFRATSYLLDLLSRYSFKTLGSSFSFLPFPAQYESGAGHLRLVAHADMGTVIREAASMLVSGATDNAAILVHTNEQADEAEACAKEVGVPYVKVSGFEFSSRKIFRDLAALMDIVANPLARVGWSRLVRHFAGRVIRSQFEAQMLVGEMFALRIDPRDLIDDAFAQMRSLRFETYRDIVERGRFVVFDTETTGLNVREDHIVQLTGVEYVKGKLGRRLNLFLKSPIPMPPEAESVHHISDAKLAEVGIDPADGVRQFLDFVGNGLLIAHNLRFDKAMLANSCSRYGIPFDPEEIPMCDTLHLCRQLHPELTVYKLGTLLETFGLEGSNSHDALDDVLAAGNLFLHLVREGVELVGHQADWLSAHARFVDAFSATASGYFAEQKVRLDGPFDLRGELRAFIGYSRDPNHPLYTCSACKRMIKERRVGEADAMSEEMTIVEGEEISTESLMRPLEELFDYLETEYADDPRTFRQVIEDDWYALSKLREADLIPDDANLVISTIHKAKGRQFDTVFIPYCQDSYSDWKSGRKVNGFPSFQVKFHGGDKAENERLLYVGMSRAKRNLVLASDNGEVSPYLESCKECFKPDFKDFYLRIRENGGHLYDFGPLDWLARLYSLTLLRRNGTEPPDLRSWFDDAVPCIRKLAFQFLPHCGNVALVDEILTAALRSDDHSTLSVAVATIKRMRAVSHLRPLRQKMLLLPEADSLKADILGAFAACLPDSASIEGLEDAVFDAYGPFRMDAARRLAAFGRSEFVSVVNGTDADWRALARCVTPRIRTVLGWRVNHRMPGYEAVRQVLRMAEDGSLQ